MSRSLGVPILALTGALLWAVATSAAPVSRTSELASEHSPDRVADDLAPWPAAAQVASDTSWIADWSFDATAGVCTDAGWVKYDPRPYNDGSNYWTIEPRFGSNAWPVWELWSSPRINGT